MSETRLGDIIDDYCSRCRLLTNHSVMALVNGEPAKVTCRTCYNEHNFRRRQEESEQEVATVRRRAVQDHRRLDVLARPAGMAAARCASQPAACQPA